MSGIELVDYKITTWHSQYPSLRSGKCSHPGNLFGIKVKLNRRKAGALVNRWPILQASIWKPSWKLNRMCIVSLMVLDLKIVDFYHIFHISRIIIVRGIDEGSGKWIIVFQSDRASAKWPRKNRWYGERKVIQVVTIHSIECFVFDTITHFIE